MRDCEIFHGDALEEMCALGNECVDAVVTDPPYGLEFMGKEWDKLGAAVEATHNSGGGTEDTPGKGNAFSRSRIRFGGTARSMQAWHHEWACSVFRVMKPGAYLLAFGGTRTYHRLACAIEDAGFEIRDSIHWIYGNGFPKSHDVGKAIDKEGGIWRGRCGAVIAANTSMGGPNYERSDRGRPVTAAAKEWEGWGTALKPAHEPIVVARKPFKGTVAANVEAHGTGAINVNGSRVTNGRWPPNVVLDPSAAEELDRSDHGGASRFFPIFRYEAKASRGERDAGLEDAAGGHWNDGRKTPKDFPSLRKDTFRRNTHPTVKPVALMQWLVRLVTPPGGLILDPFLGSGTTGIAALREGFRFVGIEREPEYVELATQRIENDAPLLRSVL